jgi:hypothetical protein
MIPHFGTVPREVRVSKNKNKINKKKIKII